MIVRQAGPGGARLHAAPRAPLDDGGRRTLAVAIAAQPRGHAVSSAIPAPDDPLAATSVAMSMTKR